MTTTTVSEAAARADAVSGVRGRKKILFVVTEDWYFCSHRLPLAKAAVEAGYEVAVATRVNRHREAIEATGARVLPLRMRRESFGPLAQALAVLELARIYRRERPDLVHHVAVKPVVLGSLAAWATGVPAVVNAVAGLGFVGGSSGRARALRPVIDVLFRFLFNRKNSCLILQNPDDWRQLEKRIVRDPARMRLIRGAGVDLQVFQPRPFPEGPVVVVMASRMLWDKGVAEFVDAARRLRAVTGARFVLVGESDAANPRAVSPAQLAAWSDEGAVEWWGRRDDMPATFAGSHIVCLPSYREGIPKVLLEAAASGRPIVTTDAPGCREVVRHEDNGLLVPPRDVEALAGALRSLIADPGLRGRMGGRGRQIAETEFGVAAVAQQTLAVYREALS